MSYTEAKLPDGDLIAILRREEGEAKCPSYRVVSVKLEVVKLLLAK